MLRSLLVLTTVVAVGSSALADEKKNDKTVYRIEEDISYLEEGKTATAYQLERCRLDLYRPENKTGVSARIKTYASKC